MRLNRAFSRSSSATLAASTSGDGSPPTLTGPFPRLPPFSSLLPFLSLLTSSPPDAFAPSPRAKASAPKISPARDPSSSSSSMKPNMSSSLSPPSIKSSPTSTRRHPPPKAAPIFLFLGMGAMHGKDSLRPALVLPRWTAIDTLFRLLLTDPAGITRCRRRKKKSNWPVGDACLRASKARDLRVVLFLRSIPSIQSIPFTEQH